MTEPYLFAIRVDGIINERMVGPLLTVPDVVAGVMSASHDAASAGPGGYGDVAEWLRRCGAHAVVATAISLTRIGCVWRSMSALLQQRQLGDRPRTRQLWSIALASSASLIEVVEATYTHTQR